MTTMLRYRLDDLGWFQFEWLCQSLLKQRFGIGVEAWGDRGDHGRDAFCAAGVQLDAGPPKGPTTFQVKFVMNANAPGAQSFATLENAVAKECVRLQVRASALPFEGTYILLTNTPISADQRLALETRIRAATPKAARVVLQGAGDICAMLDDAPQIRVAFPQLLGLADIQHLLHQVVAKSILERSTLSLERAAELAQTFLPTGAYEQALQVLQKHHFVVLTGPPEMGKTTIALIIGLAKLGEGRECFQCRRPEDLFAVRDARAKQIFISDDAFGSTEYQPTLADAWAADLENVLRAVNDTHWMIWTSRQAPLQIALSRMHLQGRSEAFPHPGDVLVDSGKLTVGEKALILYRHAKAASLEEAAKAVVRGQAKQIVQNAHFTPLRVNRFVIGTLPQLVSSNALGDAAAVSAAIKEELETPTVAMRKSFDALGQEHQAVLVSMLDAGGSAATEVALSSAFSRHVPADSHLSFAQATEQLSGHFIRKGALPGTIDWIHPSWRDLVIDHLEASSGARRRFLANSGLHGIALAFSEGGGADGRRARPLLGDEGDWQALTLAVVRLIREGGPDASRAVASLLSVCSGKCDPTASPTRLQHLATAALEARRQQWDEAQLPVAAAELSQYYQLSVKVPGLAPSPALVATWASAWGAVDEALKTGSNVDTHVGELFELMRVLHDNEPRFLTQQRFPELFVDRLKDVVDWMEAQTQWDESSWDVSEYESFIRELDDMSAWAEELGELVDGFSDMTPRLTEQFESARREVEEKIGDLRTREEDEDYPSGRYRQAEFVDVDRIFADL